ncbi:MAG: class I SAM-dependent methyltransferase [Deltaproteobacteria bacterium]|nr:class I SAM-dependent methyltransferase [Deltaproteobacteria bacterium]
MRKYTVNMTYEPFAKEPEYIEANRAFIKNIDLTSTRRILDLACGIGTMTGLIFEKKMDVTVSGLDLSRESLLIAKEHFATSGDTQVADRKTVILFQGTADCLPSKDQAVDMVIMGNAIHLLPDSAKLVGEVYRVLQPGGVFAFNSSFYAGTMPKGTEIFHHEWVKQAALYILRKDNKLRKQGLKGIPRKRGTVPGAFSKQWPSPEEWTKTLQDHGFAVQVMSERTVFMTQRNFETIGAYGGFAKVILSGYPVEEASEALQATAGPALAEVKMQTIPRLWLEVIAVKSC